MITSATPGEGKSTVAINLAITAAKLGQQTLLIEGDLRRPTLATKLNISDSAGLSDFVSIRAELQDLPGEGETTSDRTSSPKKHAIPWVSPQLREAMNCDLPVKGLKFLSAGSLPGDPGPLWASPQLREALNCLMEDFDFVVVDSPPALGIPDAVSIASCVDSIILCVGAEHTDKILLQRVRKILMLTDSNLVGVVWNKVDIRNIYGNYKYQKYYATVGRSGSSVKIDHSTSNITSKISDSEKNA
jgi:Mrp family chromosome partitioning ATPase